MADVLGTAVGVISLGLQVTQGISSYYSSFRDQIVEINSITQKAEVLEASLAILQTSLPNLRADHATSTAQVQLAITSCRDGMRRLDEILQKFRANPNPTGKREKIQALSNKAKYPFRQDTLQNLAGIVGGLQDNLNTALAILQLYVYQSISELKFLLLSSFVELRTGSQILIC